MATEIRNDDSHGISYPQLPDTRGTARIYHLRKPYYLGNHDSPLSYVMFGLWKHHLIQSGEAPPTASIREQAETLLAVRPSRSQRVFKNGLMAFAFTLVTLIGALAGATFRSTQTSTLVDGKALSANEMDFIRGYRNANESLASRSAELFLSAHNRVAAARQGNRDEILKYIRKQ